MYLSVTVRPYKYLPNGSAGPSAFRANPLHGAVHMPFFVPVASVTFICIRLYIGMCVYVLLCACTHFVDLPSCLHNNAHTYLYMQMARELQHFDMARKHTSCCTCRSFPCPQVVMFHPVVLDYQGHRPTLPKPPHLIAAGFF